MALSFGAAFLFAQAFLQAPCWSLFFLAALTAAPVWHYQKEYTLFHRRVVLTGVTLEDSWVRRWFWSGHVSGVWQVFVALFWATLLLAFGALLSPERWVVLAADVLVLALIIGPVSRRLAGQVRDEQLGFVARRWPLSWLNIAVLTLGLLILDFFLIGAPDTRGLAWNVVAEKAFSEVNATASCRFAGWLVGGLAAADRLTWHAFEVLIPSLPHKELKLAAWASFLLQVGVLSFAFTRFQLGVVALVERRTLRRAALVGEDTFSKDFLLTILVLAVLYLYATFTFRNFDPTALAAGGRKVIALANPCRPDVQALAALKSGLAAEVDSAGAAAKQRAGERIDRELGPLFAKVEQGVDDYLDWYFSVLGEYERLAALATGHFAEQMKHELEQRLFGGIGFDGRLMQASREIADGSVTQMSALASRLGTQIKSEVQTNPCRLEVMNLPALANLDRDLQRVSAAVGAGTLVGSVVIRQLARRATAAAAGKAASKKAFQAAAILPAKTVAKRGGSILLSAAGGTAVCGPLGPFAALCGVGAGVITWLTFDKAFLKIDEIRFRAAMRDEILESARGQKAELAKELQVMHDAAIDQMVSGIRESVDSTFIPVRDGL